MMYFLSFSIDLGQSSAPFIGERARDERDGIGIDDDAEDDEHAGNTPLVCGYSSLHRLFDAMSPYPTVAIVVTT